MLLTEFPEQTVIIAKDQPEYLPMPAHVAADGVVTCCWRLTLRERLRVLLQGRVWHQIMTFGSQLQPQALAARKPDLHRTDAL